MAKKQYPSIYDEHFQRQTEIYFAGDHGGGQPFDWRWLKAQGLAESGLNPKLVSPVGAKGVMQLMPATSAEISATLHLPDEMFDPLLNIKFGAYYDRRMWMMWRMERGMERLRFMFWIVQCRRGQHPQGAAVGLAYRSMVGNSQSAAQGHRHRQCARNDQLCQAD